MDAAVADTPMDRLSRELAPEMEAVNALIRERMASRHAPRIPEVTAHLVEAGGKRLRPLLTLAAAKLCGYPGPYHIHLAATVEFIHTATLLHDGDTLTVGDLVVTAAGEHRETRLRGKRLRGGNDVAGEDRLPS